MNGSTTPDPLKLVVPSIDENIRRSNLLLTLHCKLEELPPGAFPFAAELGRLRDQIAPQIGDTRILFPEFTPHDESLHVAKLYQIADKLFGITFASLNALELFLLAAALYAHDWGMAVGQEEKDFLRCGATTQVRLQSFAPLSDEVDRLNAFVRRNGLEPCTAVGLSDVHLRLYVRETHAARSAARVKLFFKENPAIGQALAHLCEGHWHEFALLDDVTRFPREYDAVGESANLLALTLQVRLIDLFHITDDRTPFALWQFVSPVELRSALEWKKHRALHGISVLSFPPGRAIKVQGSTEDEEVWPGLQDLRRYCEDQLSKTLDVSARHVPAKYGLDFLKLDWVVPTGKLRPVDLRFEFDRFSMFRILSEDIYDGDSRIFLRELLQNSIDAIRTRRARLKMANPGTKLKEASGFDTTIYISASHTEDGNVEIICRDHGIGMDEHIIRNYFSVAGVSYYRSTEFQNQNLGFEPISRFGIGILSCFMVSDELVVNTFRDPDCGPAMVDSDLHLPNAQQHRARRMTIRIPGVQRQFVVKDLPSTFQIGTEVRLRVLADKIRSRNAKEEKPADSQSDLEQRTPCFERILEVTEYLSQIAGFVEFPIHVEETWPGLESPRCTLIVHPRLDSKKERQRYQGSVEVVQLSNEYPWESVFDSGVASEAMSLFREHRFDIGDSLEGYEGWVVFAVPREEDRDIISVPVQNGLRDGLAFVTRRGGDKVDRFLEKPRQKAGTGAKSLVLVYRDGILLERITKMTERYLASNSLPPPFVRINLPAKGTSAPNVARSSLRQGQFGWDIPLWRAIHNLLSKEVERAIHLTPAARFFRIGWLSLVFKIPIELVSNWVPVEKRICLWIDAAGKLEFREGDLSTETIAEAPTQIVEYIRRQLRSLIWPVGGSDFTPYWNGEPAIVKSLHFHESIVLKAAFMILSRPLMSKYIDSHVRFLEPPKGVSSVLDQTVLELDSSVAFEPFEYSRPLRRRGSLDSLNRTGMKSLETIALSPGKATSRDRKILTEFFPENLVPIPFLKPFDTFLWHLAANRFNYLHPVGSLIARVLALTLISERDGKIDGLVRKRIAELSNQGFSIMLGQVVVRQPNPLLLAKAIFDVAIKHDLIKAGEIPTTFIGPIPELQQSQTHSEPLLPADTGRVNLHFVYASKRIKGEFGKHISQLR